MKSKRMKTKSMLSFILLAGMIASAIPNRAVQAQEVTTVVQKNPSKHAVPYTADISTNDEFYYENDDPDEIKNANITTQEAIAAKEERAAAPDKLGYYPGSISVTFDRNKAKEEAKKLGLENETALYKKTLKEFGDEAISEQISGNDIMITNIRLNGNKTVPTAIKQYADLPYVTNSEPNYKVEIIFPGIPSDFTLDGIYPIYNNDSISLGCVSRYASPSPSSRIKYRWEYCKIGTNEWQLLSDWNKSEWCTWYPDANEDYAVVCKASYLGLGSVHAETVWYVSRPQMKKQVTGRCALPDKDGILFGCTSTVGKNDAGYLTTCYIWSFDQQTWITQSAYEASNCAWFRSSVLPKGTYMMYNCTERRMPDGTRRKLSCDYYVFTI